MKTLGVIANCGKPGTPEALRRLALAARARGLRLVSFGDTACGLRECETLEVARAVDEADAFVVLGGDGTMLHASHLIGASGKPMLGVNLGKLGFLTGVDVSNLDAALDAMIAGACVVSERAVIDCSVWRGGRQLGASRALNDVVVGWGQSSRIITFDVTIDGKPMTSYRCDGIIVATPTGSTAHSLSAGGPIVHPETPALLINVLSPHTLTARPVLIPERQVIGITVAESGKELLGSVDGQEQYKLGQGDRLDIRTSPDRVRFLHLPGYNYFDVLRQKLGWRGSSAG